jgi:cysteine desulfurase/selenocysteine lyase
MPFFPEAPPAPAVEQTANLDRFLAEYRDTLPILSCCTYLNHASVGPLSDWVVQACNDQFAQQAMGETTVQDAWFDGWRLARQRVGELINAGRDEISIQPNTWEGLVRAFNALPLGHGDEALFPTDEFPSLYHALTEVRNRGCSVKAVESSKGDRIVRTEDLLNAITPATKLIATSWVNFFHGYRHDLKAIGEACRERGIWFVVDAIQGLGMLQLDVVGCGIHFLSCNGAKWMCSPLGSGFLYVSKEVPHEISPRTEGWFSMELNHLAYTDRDVSPKVNANRFGSGTVPFAPMYGLRRACEVFLTAGPRSVEVRALANADMLETAAREAGINIVSDRNNLRSAIVSLLESDCPALPGALKAANVAFSVREGAVRLSPHWYQLTAEIEPICQLIRTRGE